MVSELQRTHSGTHTATLTLGFAYMLTSRRCLLSVKPVINCDRYLNELAMILFNCALRNLKKAQFFVTQHKGERCKLIIA